MEGSNAIEVIMTGGGEKDPLTQSRKGKILSTLFEVWILVKIKYTQT